MRRLRVLLLALGLVGAFVFVPAAVYAVDPLGEACETAPDSAACGGNDSLTGSDGVIARVTNLVALVAGVLAVVAIIWGGFKYINSGGDSNKTTEARNTIVYAVVGLVVIVLAQTIVSFILNNLG